MSTGILLLPKLGNNEDKDVELFNNAFSIFNL